MIEEHDPLLPSVHTTKKHKKRPEPLVNYLVRPSEDTQLDLDGKDCALLIFFIFLGIFSRFFRIDFPSKVTFDEVYFGNFTNWYLSGRYFHDIHPPLGKLIMAGVAYMAGYKGDLMFITNWKYPQLDYITLRMTPAFFSAMCAPIAYLTMRVMMCDHFTAFVAGIYAIADLSMIAEAHLILSDGVLHFFAALAIFSIFLDRRLNSIPSLIFEGIALGCVACCKYTGLGVLLLAYGIELGYIDINSRGSTRRQKVSALRSIVLLLIVGMIHYACFSLHLALLPYYPEDDPTEIIPKIIQPMLVNQTNPNWPQRVNHKWPVFTKIVVLVLYMNAGSLDKNNTHPYASPWWSWPLFLKRWMLFYQRFGRTIACMGNIMTWYPSFIGVLWCLFGDCINLNFDIMKTPCTLFIGYCLSYLPFLFIPREIFIYHYSIPLFWAFYSILYQVDTKLKPFTKGFILSLLASLAVFGYIYWCPYVYGLYLGDNKSRIWNKQWRQRTK